MKSIVLLLAVSLSCYASAQGKRVNFDRETASSKKAAVSLSQAFQDAVKGSDKDLTSSKSALVIEQKQRLAKWTKKSKKQIIIQGTSAVDPLNINGEEKIISKESQIDTEDSLKNELTDLH